MRPGQRCPGGPASRALLGRGRSGFNEAGAALPRRSHPGPWSMSRSTNASMRPGQRCPGGFDGRPAGNGSATCFNEAGAALPRRFVLDQYIGQARLTASMRPGQRCPGGSVGASRRYVYTRPAGCERSRSGPVRSRPRGRERRPPGPEREAGRGPRALWVRGPPLERSHRWRRGSPGEPRPRKWGTLILHARKENGWTTSDRRDRR